MVLVKGSTIKYPFYRAVGTHLEITPLSNSSAYPIQKSSVLAWNNDVHSSFQSKRLEHVPSNVDCSSDFGSRTIELLAIPRNHPQRFKALQIISAHHLTDFFVHD